jgi:2-oxo-3-hexenedioate decarboxylase/2-keto-4-pentenoate hydratase
LAAARLDASTGPIGALPEMTEREAYAAQDRLHELLLADGRLGPIVGTKIGCTTKVMQDYLGMPHPCAGAIFASTVCVGDGEYGAGSGLYRPGVECEIAVRLGRDIPPVGAGAPPLDRAAVAAAVSHVLAAIEVGVRRAASHAAGDLPP